MFSASLSLAAKDTPRTGKNIRVYLLSRRGEEIKNGWPYQKRLFFTPNASENASRTPGAPLRYRTSIPYTRRTSPVQNATSAKRRKILPVPNSSNCQKREGHCKKRSPECRREQENHSQEVCNAAPKLLSATRESLDAPKVDFQGEGAIGYKFRVSGTKEMMEGAGANKVSVVLVRSKGVSLRSFELHKKEADLFQSTSSSGSG